MQGRVEGSQIRVTFGQVDELLGHGGIEIDDALELVARACEPVDESDGDAQRPSAEIGDWQSALRLWAKQQLAQGETDILKSAARHFEKTLIDCALEATQGRKQDAARLLGWGRNTITRKLKELG